MKQAVTKFATALEWIALAALGWVGYTLDFDLADLVPDSFLEWSVRQTKHNAALLVLLLAGIAAFMRFAKWAAREKSTSQLALERLATEALDMFRMACFRDSHGAKIPENVPVHHNRVTIFRHVKWKWWIWPFRAFLNPWGWNRWPWSGWLVVVQRSGHVTRTGTAVFLAPDDAQHSEGIAGEAWCRGAYRAGRGERRLPDLKSVKHVGLLRRWRLTLLGCLGSRKPSVLRHAEVRDKVATYAKTTSISTRAVWQRLKQKKLCPTSILGIQLRSQKREPWGVLVLDSFNEFEAIDTDSKEFRSALTKLGNSLQKYDVTS